MRSRQAEFGSTETTIAGASYPLPVVSCHCGPAIKECHILKGAKH